MTKVRQFHPEKVETVDPKVKIYENKKILGRGPGVGGGVCQDPGPWIHLGQNETNENSVRLS